MGKDRKSALDKGGVPPVGKGSALDKELTRVVPSIKNERDEWDLESIVCTRVAKDPDPGKPPPAASLVLIAPSGSVIAPSTIRYLEADYSHNVHCPVVDPSTPLIST